MSLVKDRLILVTIAFFFSTITNVIAIYFIENISQLNVSSTDSIKNVSIIFSMIIQLAAAVAGAVYFWKNRAHDQAKIANQKSNELLNHLVKDLKSTREKMNQFFEKDFKDDIELKRFKTSIVEEFSTTAAFIESSENIIAFNNSSISSLLAPSSIIQNHQLFTLNSLNELKNHDTDFLKSEFSTAIMTACKSCWTLIK